MAEKKIGKTKKKHCWHDEEVDWLTDLYEECPCLWDIAGWNYAKGDVEKKQFLRLVINYALTHQQKKDKMELSQSTTWERTGKRKQR